jgi:antitoxin component YwqK of YwqJK toxin-antitoxin module
MKQLLFVAVFLLSVSLSAQQKNNLGLYIDENNVLFSGTITSVNNGIKTELPIVNGEISGVAKYYNTDGSLLETGTFIKGVKSEKWMRYNANGSVSAVAFYNLGKKHGTWLVYDEAGIKRMEMVYENGEKVGTWYTYDEAGVVTSTKTYGGAN